MGDIVKGVIALVIGLLTLFFSFLTWRRTGGNFGIARWRAKRAAKKAAKAAQAAKETRDGNSPES